MSGPNPSSPAKLPLNLAVARLEERLRINPDDAPAIRRLLTILDSRLPDQSGLGAYSDCQRSLAACFRSDDWAGDLLDRQDIGKCYKEWNSILVSMGLKPRIPIAQLFTGRFHSIQGTLAHCGLFLSLFKNEGVIPRICHDCYKVQILPLNLKSLVQTYLVLRALKLPRDNSRKCMIELREDVPYPYKGYIYCESEGEAKFCMNELREAFASWQIQDVYCGISHGCSEYGLRYPEFKYSSDGRHRTFQRPNSWDETETAFFAQKQPEHRQRKDFNHPSITIRDMFGINTWIDYAEAIGDDTYRQFRDTPATSKLGSVFARASPQSGKRMREKEELAERIGSDTSA